MGLQGRLLGERYRLLRRIGSGASGTVWRGLDEVADREVAVRRPRLPGDPADETYRRAAHRLHHEARAAARVDHPAAVRIHDVVVEEAGPDGLPWIVMEWVPGESLHEVLLRGPVAAPEAARIGLAVLGALRAAHAVGIVHRAVGPANVLLGPHGRVVLTGFGTAHPPVGESLRGAGPAADLRSLGVLLHTAVGDGPAAGPLGPLIERLRAPDAGARPDAEEVAEHLAAVAENLDADADADAEDLDADADAEDLGPVARHPGPVAEHVKAVAGDVAGDLRAAPDRKAVIRSSPSA
jgi:eukaryotic-like serine/threonine-protein kinase